MIDLKSIDSMKRIMVQWEIMLVATVTLLCVAAGEVPLCPEEATLPPSQHSIATNEVALFFSNGAGIDVSVFWVNFDGHEVPVCLQSFLSASCLVCCLRLGLFIYVTVSPHDILSFARNPRSFRCLNINTAVRMIDTLTCMCIHCLLLLHL